MSAFLDGPDFNRRLFFPRPSVSAPPPGASDHFIAVPEGRLHLRQHRAPTARCAVLLFHGNGEVVADYDDAADRFASVGAALFVVDYRGYGQSAGVPTLRSVVNDAPVVLDQVRALAGGLPLVVMGRSLGGAAAQTLYGMPQAGLLAVVLESAFFDLIGLIRRRRMVPPRQLSSEELATFDPAAKLSRGRVPLLVLHGASDDVIAPDEARAALAAAGSDDKALVLIPGRGHNDVGLDERYWSALGAFLDRVQVR